MDREELSFSDFVRIVVKRKITFIVTFLVIFAADLYYTNTRVPIYEASVSVKIEKMDPAEAEKSVWYGYGVADLSTEIEVLKSLSILRKTVERIDKLPDDPVERERQVYVKALALSGSVKVSQISNTAIVTVDVQSSDPRKAALIANTIVEVYSEENTEGRKTGLKKILEYYERQIDKFRSDLSEKETELQKFKQNERIFVVTPESKLVLDRMTIDRTLAFESEMIALEKEVEKLKKVLLAEGRYGDLAKNMGKAEENDFVMAGMKRRLLELDFAKFMLLIDYTEEHPSVKEQEKLIKDVKAALVARIKDISGPFGDARREEELSVYLKYLFSKMRMEILYRILNKYYEELGSLSPDQRKYAEIKREIDGLLTTYNEFQAKKEEAKISIFKQLANISVVSAATEPKDPVKPNKRLNYTVGVIMGLILAVVAAFMAENMDPAISGIQDVERGLKLPVLGCVPRFVTDKKAISRGDYTRNKEPESSSKELASLVTLFQPWSSYSDSVKGLRTQISNIAERTRFRSFLITSAEKDEGSSTIAMNLSLSFSQAGKKTLLIGANMRQPAIHKMFGIRRAPGLSNLLIGEKGYEECVAGSTEILTGRINIDYLLAVPGLDNFSIMPSGIPLSTISELLDSDRMKTILEELKKRYDILILDAPPALPVPDVASLADKVDAVILVIDASKTPRTHMESAKAIIESSGGKIAGVVLNKARNNLRLSERLMQGKYPYAGTRSAERKKS
ncbi:MAG: AAA family ATPase [Candidatus Omnitrophica bacterium]|nr:AAA family ATPase [Candidatus Omnitrophota bacterium]